MSATMPFIPQRLTQARKMSGLSLRALSEKLGNTPSHTILARYEKGIAAERHSVFYRPHQEAPLKSADCDWLNIKTGLRNKSLLHSATVADKQKFGIISFILYISGYCKCRIYVSRRAAACKQYFHNFLTFLLKILQNSCRRKLFLNYCLSIFAVLEIESTSPIWASSIISELPP